MPGARSLAIPTVLAALLAATPARAADTEAPPPTEPGAHPTLLWAALQLVPSPEAVIWEGTAHFGARWQVTPFLYSWGINRKLRPFRTFVVEPIVRHAGSIELHVSPEVLTGTYAQGGDRWLLRLGLRSYFPILERGEALSVSLGGALAVSRGRTGASLDAGLHTLGGFFGLRVAACPTPGLRFVSVGLEVRFF